jgi:hypothetical protein
MTSDQFHPNFQRATRSRISVTDVKGKQFQRTGRHLFTTGETETLTLVTDDSLGRFKLNVAGALFMSLSKRLSLEAGTSCKPADGTVFVPRSQPIPRRMNEAYPSIL